VRGHFSLWQALFQENQQKGFSKKGRYDKIFTRKAWGVVL
jgi:hypothetical protein